MGRVHWAGLGILMVGAALTGSAFVFGGRGGHSPASSEAEIAERFAFGDMTSAMRERLRRCAAEIAEMERVPAVGVDAWANEWAGSYYTAAFRGSVGRLRVAPDSGVSYTFHGDMGLSDWNHGDIVRVLDDGLEVNFERSENDGARFVSRRLYFVRWGERRFIVPWDRMDGLVARLDEGLFDPRDPFGNFALERLEIGELTSGRRKAAGGGVPALPVEFAAKLKR